MGEWNAPHLRYIDHRIMPLVDLCNIACGAHAGSKVIMKHTINLARKNNVKVGAHPGYYDLSGFGRSYIPMDRQKLMDMIKLQVDLFLDCCNNMNVEPHHVKTHGALYHACHKGEMETEVIIDLMKNKYSELKLLVSPNSPLSALAKSEGVSAMKESFLDRSYNDDLTLMSRKLDEAVITKENIAVNQYRQLSKGKVVVSSGVLKELISDTACIHGDNPNALSILKSIRRNG